MGYCNIKFLDFIIPKGYCNIEITGFIIPKGYCNIKFDDFVIVKGYCNVKTGDFIIPRGVSKFRFDDFKFQINTSAIILPQIYLSNYSASVANPCPIIVNHPKLPGSYSKHGFGRNNPVIIALFFDVSLSKARHMADLEADGYLSREVAPGVAADKIKMLQVDFVSVSRNGIVAVGNINDVLFDVLFNHKPGTLA